MTFNVPRPQMPPLPPLNRRVRIVIALVVAFIVLLILASVFVGQYTNLLWFRSVGYSSVFGRRLVTELLLFFVFGTVMAVVVAANVVLAYRFAPAVPSGVAGAGSARALSPRARARSRVGARRHRSVHRDHHGCVGVAALGDLVAVAQRHVVREKDPQFHRDVSYFAFTYPMQRFVLARCSRSSCCR